MDFDFSTIPMELYEASESMVHALLAQKRTGQVVTLLTNSSQIGTSENAGMPMSVVENAESIEAICSFAKLSSIMKKYGSIHELADDLDWFSAMYGPYASARTLPVWSLLLLISVIHSDTSRAWLDFQDISSAMTSAAYASTLSTHHAHPG